MKWIEVIRLALDTINGHKLRSFLTLLGIIIGVASVTAVATVIEGFSQYVNESVAVFNTGAFQVQKASFQGFGTFEKFLQAQRKNPDITIDDLQALREKLSTADQVGAQDGSTLPIRFEGNELGNVGIQGTTANFTAFSTLEAAGGRYFTQFEDDNRRAVCFLGSDVAKGLFGEREAVGQTIKIGRDPYLVVGVAKPLGSFLGQSQDNFAQIPLSTFQKTFGGRRSLTLYVKPRRDVAPEATEDQTRLVMRSRHKLPYSAEDDFSITTDEHAGLSDGTDARNRHSQGARRSAQRHFAAISRRISAAVGRRRRHRAHFGLFRHENRRALPARISHCASAVGGGGRDTRFIGRRHLLRTLPRQSRRPTGPN